MFKHIFVSLLMCECIGKKVYWILFLSAFVTVWGTVILIVYLMGGFVWYSETHNFLMNRALIARMKSSTVSAIALIDFYHANMILIYTAHNH